MVFSLRILVLSFVLLYGLSSESKEIKIGLLTSDSQITISLNNEGDLVNLYNNQLIKDVKKFESYIIQNINGLISITDKQTSEKLGAFTGPVGLQGGSLVCLNGKCYRGKLLLLTNWDKKKITVVNNVDLEDYLLSVVPAEIPNTWDREALKAQSIAARSYTLGYLGRRKEKGYDLESSVEDQVYPGVSSEKISTTEAVSETKGEILIDANGKPLIALYHSSAGGYTDSIENLWDKSPSLHIQPRPDYDDKSPHFKWFRTYRMEDLSNLLRELNIGQILDIILLSKSFSNRVMWLDVAGSNGKVKMRGEDFRRKINLPSSKFNFQVEDGVIKFAGRGFGHGLGLSQWGAKALGEHGFTYKEILAHYYPGARLVEITKYGMSLR